MSDGSIKIDVKLDSSTAKKDLQTIEKQFESTGKNISKSMDNAEKSMKNIGKSFDGSKLAKQMQSVEKAIDKTSNNIDKQKQKMENLKKAYDNSTNTKQQDKISKDMQKATVEVGKLENKLNTLKDKQVNIKVKMDSLNGLDGNFRSAEMSATKSAENIKKKIEEAEKPIKNFSIAENISRTGKMLNDVGNTLSTRVTAPVTLLGIATGKIGMDFDSQMSRVKAISGATGDEFNQLKGQALQLGKDTAFSAKQAAEGMENLASAGFNTQETMAAMPGLLNLAAASGESLASSSDIAASTLRGFGLEAEQTGHVADVLAKNASATNAAVADTGEAMKYIAPVAHSMGLSLEEVTAAIGELSNSGIKGSQAGTTLRSALSRLASPSKEAAGAMKQLGFNAFDSHGKLKPLSDILQQLNDKTSKLTDQKKEDAIATIFGQEAMSGMMVLMQGGKQGLDDLTNSYKNADGAAEDMAKTMQDNAGSSVEQMMGSIETAAIKLEEVAAPTIIKIANEIQDLANRFADLSPDMQETIIKTALLAATAGPALKILGTATSGIGKLVALGGRLGATLGIIGEGAEIGGTALTAFSTAGMIATGVAGALVVGIAGAVTYNELLNKSVITSTDDLNVWEQAVNACTGGVVKSKSELQKAGLVYKDFGEGVSDSFKDGIQKATDQYHDFEFTLSQSNLGDKITEANQGKITSSISKIMDEARSAVNAKKGDLQKDLVAGMTADGSGISENEQKVLDIMSKGSDEKLAKIDEIQNKISEIWSKAISEHGKLSDSDVATIQRYVKEIEKIKAEASAKNQAESSFVENDFSERLNGLSAEDAAKEYNDTSKTIHENYSKLKATYKTETDELALQIKKSQKDLDNAQTKEQKEKIKADIETIKKEISDKGDAYNQAVKSEQEKRRNILDMLYEKNPTLKGKLNEITGEMFSTKDLNAQGDLFKIKQKWDAVANATESGMKRVQDASGKWHDVYVTVDEATGRITSAYDTFTGEFGGYSKSFEDQAKSTGENVKKSMQELTSNIKFGASNLKLEGNAIVKIDTGDTVSKLDTIVTKANGLKVAVANINGTQVKLEFDKNGAITNINDVVSAINGKIVDNPAVVNVDVNDKEAIERFKELEDLKNKFGDKELKQKISIEGEDFSKVDDVIGKFEKMPKDTKLNLKINGNPVATIDEAIEELKKVPSNTETDIQVNNDDANNKLDETSAKADETGSKTPQVTATANTDDANSNLDTTSQKADELNGKESDLTVNAETGQAQSALDSIWSTWSNIMGSDNVITKTIRTVLADTTGMSGLNTISSAWGKIMGNYTGTHTIKTGLSHVNEHGYETANKSNVKMIDNGLAFLVGNHYAGGDGINDHMTTVNEMHNDISYQVNSEFGKLVNILVSGVQAQSSKLNSIAANTSETVKVNQQGNKLNEQLAKDMVTKWNSNEGSFGIMQSQITRANDAKTKADSMTIDQNKWYSGSKSQLDDLNSQIEALQNQIDSSNDDVIGVTDKNVKKTSETEKKQLEAQKHVLDKQKDSLEKTVAYYKDAAEKEIETCKKQAEEEVKIAEAKKEKLTKFAEAVTTALKNQLSREKENYDTAAETELKTMEDNYNKKVKLLENNTKKQSDKLDAKIKALEEKSTEASRDSEKDEANNNIYVLKTKIANTADEADKRKFELELAKAQKELNTKEENWDIEDEKASLEAQKDKLSKREEAEKESLEKSYNKKKEAKEKEVKETDKYYDKLLEEDSIKAKARYTILNSSQQDLVSLLQSYNPQWQDAGQSLADSLLTGLNSQKESIQNAVSEMIGYKSETSNSKYYYNGSGQKVSYATGQVIGGYASGTSSNPTAGYYLTNENGIESSTSGDVAYVSQGASIRNAMQTDKMIKAEIARQVAQMQTSVLQNQADALKSCATMSQTQNHTQIITNDKGINLHIDKFINNSSQDIEQLTNEMGVMIKRQEKA